MEPIKLEELLAGQNVRELTGPKPGRLSDKTITGVCIDSRKALPGDLFFALKGEQSDGHHYVEQALEIGAAAVVVSEMPAGRSSAPHGAIVLVEDTLRTLGDAARNYRRRFQIPIIAITGSIGKTSVKEMSAAVLRTTCNTHASEKNYNNEIGVPLTLFGLNTGHEAAIVEMGMRGPNEIDRLAEIAEPTVGLITNIGYAHLERLGTREGIALAKAELLARLPATGTAILPVGDAYFETLRSSVPQGVRILTFSGDPARDCDVVTSDGPGYYLVKARGERYKGTLKAVGEHHFRNAAAVLALALALDIPIPAAIEALSYWSGAEGRLVVRDLPSDITVLDDCYNAGPESMESALATLVRMTNGGGVAVLGDMRELGDDAPDLHRRVGRAVVGARPRLLVTVGDLAWHIAEAAEVELRSLGEKCALDYPLANVHFADSDEAADGIRDHIRPGDTVLVKGSRAMEMEKIVAALIGRTASAERAGAHG